MVGPVALSITSAAVSSGAAWVAWYTRRRVERLTSRYADAVALIALIARADPPVAAPEVRAACDRLLVAHGVDVTISNGGRVH